MKEGDAIMKKRSALALGLGFAGAMGITTALSRKSSREKLSERFEATKISVSNWLNRNVAEPAVDLLEKAGHPDPYDTEDNTMVDEGAQYSVHYYNSQKQP